MKKLWLRAVAVWLRGTVVAKYKKFSQISTIYSFYTQIERKNRYLGTVVPTLTCVTKILLSGAGAGGRNWRSRLDQLLKTVIRTFKLKLTVSSKGFKMFFVILCFIFPY